MRLWWSEGRQAHHSVVADVNSKRTLGIICKVVLNLANGIPFGEKEAYMLPLNAFFTPQRKELAIQFLHSLTVRFILCLPIGSTKAKQDMSLMKKKERVGGGEDKNSMREWARRCIQRALLTNMDIIWAKGLQNQQLVTLSFLRESIFLSVPDLCREKCFRICWQLDYARPLCSVQKDEWTQLVACITGLFKYFLYYIRLSLLLLLVCYLQFLEGNHLSHARPHLLCC